MPREGFRADVVVAETAEIVSLDTGESRSFKMARLGVAESAGVDGAARIVLVAELMTVGATELPACKPNELVDSIGIRESPPTENSPFAEEVGDANEAKVVSA